MFARNTSTGLIGKVGALLALLGLLAAAPALGRDVVDEDGSGFDYGAVGLRAAVWVDRDEGDVYRKGETQTVGFETSEDAYAVVYRIDTEGEVLVLWPRSRLDDGFVFGGLAYELPVSGDRELRVTSSEGEGYVEAIVSRYPFDLRELELDFHHDPRGERQGFRVAGDPFLAMNEVNFAITGLEDAEEYVVTNYVSYYVHQTVDHPRYLCNQCHFEDEVVYDPYRDTCRLEITVDYRWGNTWWDTYGYYPVYASPVYVYMDPWGRRPWVNFWYDPWWVCPPVRGCYWSTTIHVWHDSDWYRGNCNVRYRDGHRRYRPLTPYDQPRGKVREYGATAPMLAAGKSARKDAGRGYEGVGKARRENPAIARTTRDQGNGGLRIRDDQGRRSSAPAVRHAAGGTRTAAGVKSVRRGEAGRTGAVQDGKGLRAGPVRRDDRTTPRARTGGGLRTVEPRNKGTRIWSTDRGTSGQQRQERSQQVRPGGTRSSGGRDAATSRSRTRGTSRKSDAVRSKGGRSGGTRGDAETTTRSQSGTKGGARKSGSRDTGKSSVRDDSSGQSGGSSAKSSGSGGSSTRSGSSGGSRSNTKATRSGGSSSRGSSGRGGGRR